MRDQPVSIENPDNTQQITIQLPSRLAERVEKYARESGNTLTGVVIEALDEFLRKAEAGHI